MAVDANKDQDSDAIDSSDDEAGAAALASDDEQDAYDATSAAADDASSSDGTPRPAVLQIMPAATQLQQLGESLQRPHGSTKAICHDTYC